MRTGNAPAIRLGDGAESAFPRSALALEVSGPPSIADKLSPERVLAERGWESPALLQRAATAREALVAARLGSGWWCPTGTAALPTSDGYALVVLAEPDIPGIDPA